MIGVFYVIRTLSAYFSPGRNLVCEHNCMSMLHFWMDIISEFSFFPLRSVLVTFRQWHGLFTSMCGAVMFF